jgi:hypothetical protein
MTSYRGESVSELGELDADKVIPAWPDEDEAGILAVADFVEGELLTTPWTLTGDSSRGVSGQAPRHGRVFTPRSRSGTSWNRRA